MSSAVEVQLTSCVSKNWLSYRFENAIFCLTLSEGVGKLCSDVDHSFGSLAIELSNSRESFSYFSAWHISAVIYLVKLENSFNLKSRSLGRYVRPS